MAKNYVVAIILEGKDKDLKKTMREAGVEVDDLADRAEAGGQRMQQALTGAAIAMTFGKSIPLMRKAIDLYAQAESATTSLGSAAKYAGVDFNKALGFLQDYTQDGLIPLAQASLSLKNLLLAGYGLERSMEMMKALKDFAAYGRQGQLSMGEAVQRATEGLKNQMSQLVDNAGLTKNLAVMYKEYAVSVGKGAGSLTESEKVTAAYLGTMREWGAVQGDASKASAQLVGDMARQDARIRVLYETLGKGLEPDYRQLLVPLGKATAGITAFANVNPEATATLLGGAGLVAAVGALAAAFALMGPGGAIVIGIAAALVGTAGAAVTLAGKLKPSNEAVADAARTAGDAAEQVRALKAEYVELKDKPDLSAKEHGRLRDVMGDLARLVPEAVKAFGEEGEILGLNTSSLSEYVRAMEIVRDMKLEEYEKRATEAQREREAVQARLSAKIAAYDTMLKHGIQSTKEFTGTVVEGGEELYSMNTEMVSSTVSVEDLQNQIRALAAELRDAEVEEKRTKKTLAELRGESEDTNEVVAETTVVVEELGTAVGESAKAIDGWNATMDVFFERHARFPQTVEDWQEFLSMLRENIPEAADEISGLSGKIENFRTKLARATTGWGDFEQFGVDSIGAVTNTFGASLGTILKFSGDTAEQLHEIWASFFDWVAMAIGNFIAQWAAMQILKTIFPGFDLFGAEGGTVRRAAGGGTLARAAGGGVLRGSVAGFDRVPVLAQIDETFLSTDLTRRMDRMVGDYDSARAAAPISTAPPADMIALQNGGGSAVFHIYAIDSRSLSDQIRRGPLGRELLAAARYGQLTR